MTSSPRARTEPRTNQERRRARNGGRWWHGRAPSSLWRLGSSVDTAKGLDGGRKVCGLSLYSPKTLQLRKEGDLEADSIVRTRERNRARRGEEGGPDWWTRSVSDTQRRQAAARASWANGAHWARPRRDAGKQEMAARAGGKQATARVGCRLSWAES
jgi:hypothetical protein